MTQSPGHEIQPYKVLVVDDDAAQLRLAQATLRAPKYQVVLAVDGRQAVERLHGEDFDAVLLDRRMPGLDGHAVLRHIRGIMDEPLLPVIMVTAFGGGGDDISQALGLGATDFIRKPYDPLELMARVDAAVAHKRLTDQLEDAESILFAQARMAEARDHHTGDHVARVARNALVFGRVLGLPAEDLQVLRRGAVLHDIGKLGIPDAILLKPGKLSEAEWAVMKSHTVIGERLVSGMRRMRPAAEIIRSHHERWDGGGYPDGLRGEAIPLLARVFQLVDIHDALAYERPYKTALSAAAVAGILEGEAKQGWRDPQLTTLFLELLHKRPQDLEPRSTDMDDLGQSIFDDITRTGALAWTHGEMVLS
ncbi:MAG: response regulator [Pseudomonadota bacterium]|nr:response regulator [Pseudomonadota bacterium]MDP1903206.1 response regulator [Pseudomonadota bacterium]MDP2354419.1 response regulator [Pseudomonadota bacterium]